MDPINVSDHTMISATLEVSLKRIKKCTELIISKPKWKKCDIEVYRNSIKENIMEVDNLEENCRNYRKIRKCTTQCCQTAHTEKNSRIKRSGHKIWNGNIAHVSKISKSKFYTWKMNKNNNNAKKKIWYYQIEN
jgi:hypothetical protein